MLCTLLSSLIQAMPAGADPMVEKMVDLEPVMAGGPPFRRLFLDAMVVEESAGLERVFHAATKYEGNPVFGKDRDWEGWGPCGINTVKVRPATDLPDDRGDDLPHDRGNDLPDDRGDDSPHDRGDDLPSDRGAEDRVRLRMYYFSIGGHKEHPMSVAESEDGIHWTKPVVGDVEWNGSKQNNIVFCTGQVMRLAHPPSPAKTWVCLTNTRLGYSADGLHWKWEEREGELFSSSDVMSFFFDPYNNRMAATWKCASRRLRSAGVVWSEDLEHWVKPYDGPVMVADDLDPDATQIYGMPVFAYQGMYIGHPWLYHSRIWRYGGYSPQRMYEAQEGSSRIMDTHIAWSWDLINWTRTPKREPFIPVSPYYGFDCGMVNTNTDVIVMGDELWFYYTGCDQVHDEDAGTFAAIGLAKLRMDGFCSMQAGDEEGWLISRREVFNTPKVIINAKCKPGGYVAAELLDRYNHVIPGFEWYYSNAFTGDSVRGELTWAKHPTFADMRPAPTKYETLRVLPDGAIDQDKKIRFRIRNADLFSYLPVDINQEIDDGWPD